MNAMRETPQACPSRYRIDRLLAGELESEPARALERHAETCVRCGSLLARTRLAQQAFPRELPEAVARRVRQRGAAAGRLRSVWPSRAAGPLAGALALAAVLAVASSLSVEAPRDGVRTKGGPRVTFYVRHDGNVREGGDGERVQPGDALQFAYGSARAVHLAVVSVDPAGHASAYYGRDGRAVPLPAAAQATLDQSTLLDATLGRETIYALSCSHPLELEPILRALERSPATAPAPADCTVERYRLIKVAR